MLQTPTKPLVASSLISPLDPGSGRAILQVHTEIETNVQVAYTSNAELPGQAGGWGYEYARYVARGRAGDISRAWAVLGCDPPAALGGRPDRRDRPGYTLWRSRRR